MMTFLSELAKIIESVVTIVLLIGSLFIKSERLLRRRARFQRKTQAELLGLLHMKLHFGQYIVKLAVLHEAQR